ncbi:MULTISPECIES: LysR family transcriptional regulator [Massilia]|nr:MULTISPECIES: LysR family transcriptional regulator [Telluria group]KQY18782.1 LysR family transcriptional regulator [Massilia sp. Root133]KQZ53664.1 LysR family transcriptional regulator [Massilia sp. Root1485]MDN4041513.1 LysR family transcriptional regulator [Massilia sp. YIM B02787]
MKSDINFRHLYYFWVVANEGGITRAAERLGLAVQTVSSQLTLLEQALGKTLFAQQGRRLVLTEAGRLALGYADQIFLLGEQMQEALNEFDSGRTRLTVGISDSLPKLSAYRMLEAVTRMDRPVRIVCYEDQFEALLADLALHKLDVVLTDREVRAGATLKVFSHQLFDSEMVVVGTPVLAQRYGGADDAFPQNLNGAPFLLPARNNALRGKIDEWFVQHHVRPDVVGEFEDNALLNTFGRRGLGLFFAPAALADDVAEQFGAVRVGLVPTVREQFYMISSDRKIMHPAVEAILAGSRKATPPAA